MAETNLTLQVELPELYKAMCTLVEGMAAYERTLSPEASAVFGKFTDHGVEAVGRALKMEMEP